MPRPNTQSLTILLGGAVGLKKHGFRPPSMSRGDVASEQDIYPRIA
jgi:hypothetical protein